MTKKRRAYISRVVGDQVMTSADLERLHKELLEYERIDFISDEMRAVIEDLWPELVHKLPPKKPQGRPTVVAGECPLYPPKDGVIGLPACR